MGWQEMAREMNEQDPEGTAKLLGGAWVGSVDELKEALTSISDTPPEGHTITHEEALDVAAAISAPAMQSELEIHLSEGQPQDK